MKYKGSTVRIKYKGLDRKITINEEMTEEEKQVLIDSKLEYLLSEKKTRKKKVEEEPKEEDNGEA